MTTMTNKLVQFRRTIYSLKKQYGFYAELYRPTETVNLITGRKVVTAIKYHLNKAIFLPNQLFRDWSYGTIIRSAAQTVRNLNLGGIFDATQRRIIVDKRDLPKGFSIRDTDYIVFNHNRYELIEVNDMELADFWFLSIKQLVGEPPRAIYDLNITHRLELNETINQNPVSYQAIWQDTLYYQEALTYFLTRNRNLISNLNVFDFLTYELYSGP